MHKSVFKILDKLAIKFATTFKAAFCSLFLFVNTSSQSDLSTKDTLDAPLPSLGISRAPPFQRPRDQRIPIEALGTRMIPEMNVLAHHFQFQILSWMSFQLPRTVCMRQLLVSIFDCVDFKCFTKIC